MKLPVKTTPDKYPCRIVLLIVSLVFVSPAAFSQVRDSLSVPNKLKLLSLEELMNMEVTSVSKHPEKLMDAPSAIQVITQKDIRSSGAKTLPEALPLASNLQVAQVNSSQWAISARGFNNVLANKLLVLIDGVTVYTPMYAGVFWDVQNVLLEDVDRIEVISGPGGTLWGANAVNGVINVITKNAADTKGLFVEAAAGSSLPWSGSLRYGGQFGEHLSYRLYGMGFKMGNTLLLNDTSANDQWTMAQGGFRIDWRPSANSTVTIQSNIYDGRPKPDSGSKPPVIARGDNLLARWNYKPSDKFDFQLQVYYDHRWRDFNNGLTENLKTYDIEWQNRYKAGENHELTYGLNFRWMDHHVNNLEFFAFRPADKLLHVYSLFLQDKIMLLKKRLYFTIGSKMEHNVYTGFEYQPGIRLAWTPAAGQTVWGAVSRAVRTPSRIDREFYFNVNANFPVFTGGNFISEEALAYELGWRLQPLKNLSLSVAPFFNVYDNIRSAEPGPPPLAPFPITIANGVKGKTFGVELSAAYQLNSWGNIRGGYTFLKKELTVKPDSRDMNKATAESDDPRHQFLIQSAIDLPGHIQWGTVFRYTGKLSNKPVPAYMALDIRIGWKFCKVAELSLVAQNLLDDKHPEFVPSSPSPREIERSVYGQVTVRL